MPNQFAVRKADKNCSIDTVVGMAVYIEDRVEWVQQAVDSILQQTYSKFLFVIVLDGEVTIAIKDYLEEVSRADDRLVLVTGISNVGLSRCMNFIIEWAADYSPKYFFRMDADDISKKDRLATQIEFLNSHPEVSIVGSALSEINEQGLKVGKRKLPLKHNDIVKLLPKRCSLNHPTVAIRFDVFKAGFRYKNELMNTQDYYLWAELAAAGYKFTNLSQKLLKFRRVNDFYKRRGLGKSINEFRARLYTMKLLNQYTVSNLVYAFAVLSLRLMPSKIIKIAYTLDRYLLEKIVKH